jgi:membrane-associated phospholipid phosphatase
MVLLAFKAASGMTEALEWASISVVLSVLPVFAVVIYLVRRKKLDGIFVNSRQQRHRIYLLAGALGAISCGVLWYFRAPELLAVSFTAGLVAIVIFMVINLFWKISLHTAFMSAAVSVLTIVYGAHGAWTILLVPLVAWARLEMKLHSAAQVTAGALLAAFVTVVVFRGFGMVG